MHLTDSDRAIHDIAATCLYPELAVDIGAEPPDTVLNEAFRVLLAERLRSLFDRLRLHDGQHAELQPDTQLQLTLLYCEQTAKHADFQCDDDDSKRCLGELGERIRRWLLADDNQRLQTDMLAWYKDRLTVGRWRRQAGAILGLARFAVLCYPGDSQRLGCADALFLLAAGSLAMEHLEDMYKEIALDMFVVLLRNIHPGDMIATRLADPIFDLTLRQVSIVKALPVNRLLWQCLFLCALHKNSCDPRMPSVWSSRDDMCLALMTRLAFENDANIRLLLIRCIPPAFGHPGGSRMVTIEDDYNTRIDVPEMRRLCSEAGVCLAACRWTKKLSKILAYHLSCCFGAATDVALNVRAVHVAYLVTLYAMPTRLCAIALRELLDELSEHLLQLLRHSDRSPLVRTEVVALLESLRQQIESSPAGAASTIGQQQQQQQRYFVDRAKTIDVILQQIAVVSDG